MHLELWGKTAELSGFHPLACHLLDVAAVSRALLESSDHRQSTACRLLGLPSSAHLSHLPFWVALHDLGKATPTFQRIAPDQLRRLQGLKWTFSLAAQQVVPHATMTAGLLRDPAFETFFPPTWRSKIGVALSGHHGAFGVAEFTIPLGKADPKWRAAQSALVSEICSVVDPTPVSEWPDGEAVPPAGWAWFAGLVTLADWIGSNSNWFSLLTEHSDVNLSAYYAARCHIARGVVARHGFSAPAVAARPVSFAEVFGRSPRPLQTVMEQIYRDSEVASPPQLIIIEAPMGEGKTEAALYAATASDPGLGAGFYIGLPTQATSNQMFGRVAEFLRGRVTQASVIALLHGQASLNQDFQRLSPTAIDRDESETLTAEEWFSGPKRGLLAPFAVGTVDQALMAVLQVKHYCLRGMALAGKTVIIDEVHAYDVYTSTLIDRLVQWLGALGARVILLSATLPRRRVRELTAKFGAEWSTLAAYPRVTTVVSGRSESREIPMPPRARRTTLQVEVAAESDEQTARWFSDKLTGGGCGVWIRNTVREAQWAFQVLRATDPTLPLRLFHARFRAGDRANIERDCLAFFGPNGNRPARCLLIATQVVEQSLDLDFDVMGSDHAPIDLLLQRSGRLHRHPRKRPSVLATPILRIMTPEFCEPDQVPDFGPSEYVYQRSVLLRSLLAIRPLQQLRVPEDIEQLIESVYGDERPTSPDARWATAITAAEESAASDAERSEFHARLACVAAPSTWDPLERVRALDEDDPEVHRTLRAATRESEPSLRLVFLFRRDDGTVSDTPGGIPFDPADTADQAAARLLAAVINVQDKRVVFNASSFSTPPAWTSRAILRYLRLALLENEGGSWALTLKSCRLVLDPILGLRIETCVDPAASPAALEPTQ